MKHTIRLTEKELRNMIAESVRRALNEEVENQSSDEIWQEYRDARDRGADANEMLAIARRLDWAIERENGYVVGGPYKEDMLVQDSPNKLGWRSNRRDAGMEIGKDGKKRPHKGYERGWEK